MSKHTLVASGALIAAKPQSEYFSVQPGRLKCQILGKRQRQGVVRVLRSLDDGKSGAPLLTAPLIEVDGSFDIAEASTGTMYAFEAFGYYTNQHPDERGPGSILFQVWQDQDV